MQSFNIILAVVVCLSLFGVKRAYSSGIAREASTPAERLRAKAVDLKRERQADQKNRETLLAQNPSRVSVPAVMKTTQAQQKAAEEGSSEGLGVQNDPQLFIYIGETFVVMSGHIYAIIDGKISYNGNRYVVCNLTVALDSLFLCCGGSLVDKSVGPIACCSNTYIFTNTEFCCGEYFYPKNENIGCCKEKGFLETEESCCEGVIAEQPTCPCKAGPQQFCCAGRVFPQFTFLACCPEVGIYFPNFQTCCGSSVISGQSCL